jgi:hypothetical protein
MEPDDQLALCFLRSHRNSIAFVKPSRGTKPLMQPETNLYVWLIKPKGENKMARKIPDPGEGPVEVPDNPLADEEAKLLKKLLGSISADPQTKSPFQNSTLSWSVGIPPEAASLTGLRYSIGGAAVERKGTKVVSPLETQYFTLKVQGKYASHDLDRTLVTVNKDGCRNLQLSYSQMGAQADKFMEPFMTADLSARSGVTVTAGADQGDVIFKVPLKAVVEDFYDADIDVRLIVNFSVQNGQPVVTLDNGEMDISFHILEHIGALGLAAAIQGLLETFAGRLVTSLLRPQLEEDFVEILTGIIGETEKSGLLQLWQNQDSAKRPFKLYALQATTDALLIWGCPQIV